MQTADSGQYTNTVFRRLHADVELYFNVNVGIDFINPMTLLSINAISNIGIDFVITMLWIKTNTNTNIHEVNLNGLVLIASNIITDIINLMKKVLIKTNTNADITMINLFNLVWLLMLSILLNWYC